MPNAFALAGHFCVYLVVRVLIAIVGAIPLAISERIAWVLAWLFTHVIRIRYRVADENLRHSFPELTPSERRAVIFRMWHHLFLLILEIVHTSKTVKEENWRQFVELRNVRPLVKTLLEDRPVILVTGHFGNFEFGGYMLGLLGFPTYTVARNLDNPFLDRYLAQFRSEKGQYLIPKNGGAEQIQEVMRRGGTVAVLADQDAGPKGCFVDFFGRSASAYKAMALLALQYDAIMAVVYVRRLEKPLHFEMGMVDLLDPRQVTDSNPVRFITQWYTSHLENVIRVAPEQYWWIHRRWKSQPRRANRPSVAEKTEAEAVKRAA